MAEKVEDKEIKRKCAHSGVPLKRLKRYYRNGLYYRNKASFMAKMKDLQAKEKEKEAEKPVAS